MDLVKSIDFFDPCNVTQRCHIIGCGSVGSTVAEMLARLGITKFSLYDFDVVEPRNIANQMFVQSDIKAEKVDAVQRIITDINPESSNDISIFREGYIGQRLSGFVFLCVDDIDLRRKIVKDNQFNQSIKAMFDFRTRLEDAQHYAALWSDPKQIINLLNSMAFSHEEAHDATPVTACNVEMGIAPTVRIICAYGVANFMNVVLGRQIKKIVICNAFTFEVDAY